MTYLIPVTLTWREVAMAADCGVTRHLCALKDGRRDAFGLAEDAPGWQLHIEGACGEVAVAKALGRFWSPTVNTFDLPDIGETIAVRTRSRHDYELPFRKKDDPSYLFVLVTGWTPEFVVRGYIRGRDAQKPEWWKEHGGRPGAWFVPQDALSNINALVAI